ncbi:MAG: TonB-dependent receptor [Saprospiraceae bacterium]|nr:TonB-dependent receptor [Saprospiraceae bacterium]
MTSVIRFFLVFLWITPLFSQTADSLTDVSRLSEVVIQATRVGHGIPVPHTNLKEAEIKKRLQAQDLPYLLSGFPSVVESSDAGAGIGYTGMRVRGSDPTRVNVTINGIPLNDAESQGVFWVDLPDLAASASEIQVQRGVGSSTNGAGAFGATVNIDLSKIDPEPSAGVSLSLGSFGTKRVSVQSNTGLLNKKWSFTGRASVIQSDGFIDRASADLQSMHLKAAYSGDRHTMQLHLLSGREITYQAWNGVPAQFINHPELRTFNSAGTESPGEPYKDEVDHYTQNHWLAHYKLQLNPVWQVQLNGHYTRGFGYYEQYKADQHFENYGLNALELPDTQIVETDLIRRRWLDNHFYGGTFVLKRRLNQSNQDLFLLGGAVSRYDGRHFGEIIWSEWLLGQGKDFRYYDNSADKLDANLFVKLQKSIGQQAGGYIDLQIRRVTYQFSGFNQELLPAPQNVGHLFFNPKLGFTLNLSKFWETYGFAGVAHREPNRDDYVQSSPASRPKPERLYDLELGAKWMHDHANFSANLYYMRYKDQLVLDGGINDVGAYIRTNVADSHRLGLELEGQVQVSPSLLFSANAAISRNKINGFLAFVDDWDTGEQQVVQYGSTDLSFSPSIVSNAELQWQVLNTEKNGAEKHPLSLTCHIRGKYVGKQYLDNTSNEAAVLPGYFYSDVRLNFTVGNLLGKEIGLIISCNNWLNKKYEANGWVYRFISQQYDPRPDDPYAKLESGSTYHLAGYFPQAGRTWMLTCKVDF